jgi:hypothetical protein
MTHLQFWKWLARNIVRSPITLYQAMVGDAEVETKIGMLLMIPFGILAEFFSRYYLNIDIFGLLGISELAIVFCIFNIPSFLVMTHAFYRSIKGDSKT